MDHSLESRSVRDTASEVVALSAFLGSLVFVPVLAVAFNDAPAALSWVVGAGELLYGQLSWTLGLYIAVLLAFYAVSFGRQLIGEPARASRTRRILGAMAELIAAATVVLMILVGFYLVLHSETWAILVVLLPAVGLLAFLALQLGGLVVGDRAFRLATAEHTRSGARARLTNLRLRAGPPVWLVIIVDTVVIAALAIVVTVLSSGFASDWRAWFLLFGIYAVVGAVLVIIAGGCRYLFFIAEDWVSRSISVVASSSLFAGLGVLLVANSFGDEPSWPASLSMGLTVLLVSASCLGFLPLAGASRWWVDWSIQGAGARVAARAAVAEYAKATREIVALRATTPGPRNFRRRLSGAFDSLRE